MRRLLVSVVFLLMPLAGCMDAGAPALGTVDAGDVMPFKDIVQERPVLASTTVHEDHRQGTHDLLDLDGDDGWAPRDVELTYHGVGLVHDEWGRLLEAHVFRYRPMVYVITDVDVDLTTGQIDMDGEYQEKHWEMYFDAADGRAMGLTDLDRGVRSFADPLNRLPFGPGYAGNLLLWMVHNMHGDLTAEISVDYGFGNVTYWMEPYTGLRPLPGDCEMYQERSRSDRESGVSAPKLSNDPHRSLACFDHSMVPLWHWAGNETGGSRWLQRTDGGFGWPGPAGRPQPPEPFARAPMEGIAPLLPTSDPIYVPPASSSGYAKAVRDRVAALHQSAPYQEFELLHDATYAHDVVAGWPPHAFVPVLGGLLGQLNDMARVEETTWVRVNEADDWFWTNVHTMHVGEGAPRYVPDQNGATFTDSWAYPSRETLGDVVQTFSVSERVPDLAPLEPRFINWMVWPDFDVAWQPMAWWSVASHCFETAEDPRFLMFDGIDGHLMAAGSMQTHPNGCSMGSFMGIQGRDLVEVFPPGPDQPVPLVAGPHGALALPRSPIAGT